jgi:ABC-type transport system involved in multi-copper enzyme maturation permease subunit
VSSLRPLARLSPWWYYAPGALIDRGTVPWLDAGVLLFITLATGTLAVVVFIRRDLT